MQATKLLAKQKLRSTKINVFNLEYDKKIVFFSIQEYANVTNTPIEKFYIKSKLIDGCTIYDKDLDLYIVLYNEKLCASRRNWTLAHEIGHIYLGHTKDTDKEEIEAHFFAAQLLIPEYVLYMMSKEIGDLSHRDITSIFFVSKDAALKRIDTFKKKTSYECSELDKYIWSMLEDDVRDYLCKSNHNQNPLPYIVPDEEFDREENFWLYGFL